MPSPPDCDENPTRPRTGAKGANVAFIETSGLVLTIPMQLGPITRMPWRRARPTSSRSASACEPPTSAKPAEITTIPCTPARTQSCATSGTAAAGTTTIARSTRSGTSTTLGYAAHAGDRRRARVDRVDRARELAREQVAQDLVADRAWPPAGADDRDRRRREDPRHRPRLGLVLARASHGDRLRRRVDRERHLHGPAVEPALHLEARVGEDPQHLLVVRHRERLEAVDAGLAGDRDEVLEEDRCRDPVRAGRPAP